MGFNIRVKQIEKKVKEPVCIDPMVYEALDLLFSAIPHPRSGEREKEILEWIKNNEGMEARSSVKDYENLKRVYGV